MTTTLKSGGPTNTLTKLHNWFPDISAAQSAAGKPAGGKLKLSDTYEVNYLSLAGIISGDILKAVHTSRWRHLVKSDGIVLAEIELDELHEPVALHKGVAKDGFLSALNYADTLPGDYEASVIEATGIHFVALWLHGDSKDLFIPYEPNATSLTNYKAYSEQEVLAVLQPLAHAISAQPSASEPKGG